jgi:hypothetical protein
VRIWNETKNGSVRIWVEDNGIGIPKQAQPRLFAMFQKLDNQYEGGIGLSIVRKVIERMLEAVNIAQLTDSDHGSDQLETAEGHESLHRRFEPPVFQEGEHGSFNALDSVMSGVDALEVFFKNGLHGRVRQDQLAQVNPALATTFFHKKPEGLPFLWLSQVIMPSKEGECRAKLRQLLTLPPLHVGGPPASIFQVAHAQDSIVAQTTDGDIHINQKKVVRPQITREPGDIAEETAHAIQDLIRQLSELDEEARNGPSYGEHHQRLKNRYKVASYRKLSVAQGEDAIQWLRQELGRKIPTLRRRNNPEWRKRIYAGIWAAAKELGWDRAQVHAFANSAPQS